jgi:osmotically-inducible protein OsmY
MRAHHLPTDHQPETSSDEILRQHLLDELLYDPRTSQAQIEVDVKRGVAVLAGVVGSNAVKQAAARSAERIDGIRAVANGLTVRSHPDTLSKDVRLAERVANVLSWTALLGEQHVGVRVEHGWVILDGMVRSSFQRLEAESAVHALSGVLGITNRIRVADPTAPAVAAARIRSALARQGFAWDCIQVTAEANAIVLRGLVDTPAERRCAEEIAWNSGVQNVENLLAVLDTPMQ